MELNNLISMFQAAISPVALISGVGLLILSMTNRLARVVDRLRQFSAARHSPEHHDSHHCESQITIFIRRAELLRRAILYATVSVFLAALLVIDLFLSTYLELHTLLLSVSLFVLCSISLVTSLIYFIQDINLSLAALYEELNAKKD